MNGRTDGTAGPVPTAGQEPSRPAGRPDDDAASNGTDPDFESLVQYLKEERGFDFTGYKRSSLVRRVRRRMESVGLTDFEQYHDHLLLHPGEFTALFNTILINVTGFFRDPEAWEYLARSVVPDLLARRDDQDLRLWCAGCASGAEAYSLAMVLAEAMGLAAVRERVKIYATDVDEEALAHARLATYTAKDVHAVPTHMREKYLEPVGERFTVRKELRRVVIFGRNDLVRDAPISHVDILTCRNTLMYFNAETQGQILNRFHFALKPDGLLMLGKAEMLLNHATRFRPVDLRRRIFRKVADAGRDRRFVLPPAAQQPVTDPPELTRARSAALMAMAPATLLVDVAGHLVLANRRASQLLGISTADLGRPLEDLQLALRPEGLQGRVAAVIDTQRPVHLRTCAGRWPRQTRARSTCSSPRSPTRRAGWAPPSSSRTSRPTGSSTASSRAPTSTWRRRTRSCRAATRSSRAPTRSCSPRSRSSRPRTRSCRAPTKSSRP